MDPVPHVYCFFSLIQYCMCRLLASSIQNKDGGYGNKFVLRMHGLGQISEKKLYTKEQVDFSVCLVPKRILVIHEMMNFGLF